MQKHYIKIKRAKTAIVMMSGFLLLLFSVTFLFPPANTPNKASAAPVTSSSSINIQTSAVYLRNK